jgi:hypothetical protein
MFSIGQPLITLSNETHIFKNLIGFKKKKRFTIYIYKFVAWEKLQALWFILKTNNFLPDHSSQIVKQHVGSEIKEFFLIYFLKKVQ